MSDVLVKGMRMPKNCSCCDMCCLSDDKQNFFCTRQIGKLFHWTLADQRQEGCPLVELPENHGRIVDLDRVLGWLVNEKRVFSMKTSAIVVKALKSAPTILEASNKTETPRKARICPHYQGVCGLDDDVICYCSSSYEMCYKYRGASNG